MPRFQENSGTTECTTGAAGRPRFGTEMVTPATPARCSVRLPGGSGG